MSKIYCLILPTLILCLGCVSSKPVFQDHSGSPQKEIPNQAAYQKQIPQNHVHAKKAIKTRENQTPKKTTKTSPKPPHHEHIIQQIQKEINFNQNIGKIYLKIQGAKYRHYYILDNIIKDARTLLQNQPKPLNPLNTMQIIGNLLAKKYHIVYRDTDLLVQALDPAPDGKRYADCDVISIIYCAIGEALNLPIVAVSLPEHMYVNWQTPKYTLAWETTNNQVIPKGEYKKVYPLTKKETIGLAYSNRGLYHKDQGELTKAIEDYTKAIALNPRDPEIYYNRGHAKDDLKKYREAIKDYTKAITLNPKDSDAYYNRGHAKDNLANYQGAIQDYNKAIELNPSDPDAYYNRGIAKEKSGDRDAAEKDYQMYEALQKFFGN